MAKRTEKQAAAALRDLVIEWRLVSSLIPFKNNPRTHTKKQISQIADSIRTFGWTNPILIDADSCVMAGHGRLEAAGILDIERVPTIRIEDMTEAQKRAYVLADNKLAENAGWDRELLALELQGLLEMDLDFEVTLTGFEMGEIDVLIGDLNAGADDEADRVPETDPTLPATTKPGDLWQLGQHRLLCADATNPESFERLMSGEPAEMVFTDPPYNVPIIGHVCGLGSVKHGDFAMASGEMTEPEFIAFLTKTLGAMAANSKDGAIHFACIDWRHIFELLTAGSSIYSELKNICVWTKPNGGMGSLYRSQHEFVAVFKKGSAPHINNVVVHRRQKGEVLHPTRESLAVLAEIKQEMGSLAFSSQYLQRPVPLEGNLIKRDWLKWYDALPSRGRVVQSWDVASTTTGASDWSVCTTWLIEKRNYYLVDVWRGRLEFPQLRHKLIALARGHAPNEILIEQAGPGLHLVQELRAKPEAGVHVPIGIKPEGDKIVRMEAQCARFEAGQVFLPKEAPWLSAFLHEILAFPNTRYDDQVDSVSQLLCREETRYETPSIPCGDPIWPFYFYRDGRRWSPADLAADRSRR